MPSRMDKYCRSDYDVKKRTSRNQELYKSIYEDAEYSNVEGISIIEKNERIDINKIRELIGSTEVKPIIRERKKEVPDAPIYYETEIEKNYDIRDILDKAKNERPEIEKNNTQYDILKGIRLNDDFQVPQSLSDEELKKMIESITLNSKVNQTGDLLDDLKTLHPSLNELSGSKELKQDAFEIDKTFFTSSLGFSNDDFEDLIDIKEDIKKNNILTKVLIFVLLVVFITGVMFLIYHFAQK